MNLIEAWEKAKEGQKVKRKNPSKVHFVKMGDFLDAVYCLSEENRYANDWVMVVPKKEEVIPVQVGIVEWFRNEDGYKIPVATFQDDDENTLNFDSLIGKRTRLTIEVL